MLGRGIALPTRSAFRWFALGGLVVGVLILQQLFSYLVALTGVEVLGPGSPEYRQTTEVTCGPASLRFVLHHKFGQEVSEKRIAELAQTSETGTTLLGLKQAATALGHEAYVWRWSRNDFISAPVPSVIYLPRWHHFAVLTEVRDTQVVVFDPLRGALKFTPRSFQLFWDGIVLEVK